MDVDKLTWVIATTFDTVGYRGRLVVEPDHYHGLLRCEGTLALADLDGTTTETVTGRLDVAVPLVGGSAEKAIFAGFTKQLGLEAMALGTWCAAHPA